MSKENIPTNPGRPIATFRGNPIDAPTWIFIFLPGAIGIAAIYLYGIYLAAATYQQHGPALAVARSQSWFLLGTILLFLLAAYVIYRMLASLKRIQVYEWGLKLRNFFLLSRSYSWKELSGISSSATRLTFIGNPVSTTPTGKLFTSDGRSIDISRGYLGLPKLIKIIKTRLYPLIWPKIKSDILARNTVRFGRITISREGVQISNRTIPWDSISRLHTRAGFLVIELHDKSSRKVPTIDIPNLELLLEAVEVGYH